MVDVIGAATVRVPPVWQFANPHGLGDPINKSAMGLAELSKIPRDLFHYRNGMTVLCRADQKPTRCPKSILGLFEAVEICEPINCVFDSAETNRLHQSG